MQPDLAFRPDGSNDAEDVDITGKEFFQIMRYYKRKWFLALTILFSVISGLVPLFINFFFGSLMNTLTKPDFTKKELGNAVLILVYFIIGYLAILIINFGLRGYSNPLFMTYLRDAIYSKLMTLDIEYFDKVPTGILIGRLSQDVSLLFQIYVDRFLNEVMNLTQAVGGVILGFYVMWHATIIVTGIIIICAIIYYVADKFIARIWNEFNKRASTATAKAEEVMTSFRIIKSFDNELYEAKQYGEVVDKVNDVFNKTSIAQGLKDSIMYLIVNSMNAGLVYLASYFIIEKPSLGYENGDLLILIFSLMISALGLSSALSMSDDFKRARVSAAKILKILRTEPKVDQQHGGEVLESIRGKIEFRDVGFKYPGANEWAIRHLSFIIEPGQTAAFVGESGCGKSTTLQLLQRFYEIQEGTILIDDVDMKTLNPQYLRSLISFVPQGPVLFSMSIKDNIRYAKPKASNEEVVEAARIGNAHNFIMEIPDNYASKVQQTSLSGGQKQRICISRAILANSPILLLDEATAALDTESERLVQQSLETFRHGKTAILVAHRLATVIHSDIIFVFEDGHIVEKGQHQELMRKEGIYSNLVKYQLQ